MFNPCLKSQKAWPTIPCVTVFCFSNALLWRHYFPNVIWRPSPILIWFSEADGVLFCLSSGCRGGGWKWNIRYRQRSSNHTDLQPLKTNLIQEFITFPFPSHFRCPTVSQEMLKWERTKNVIGNKKRVEKRRHIRIRDCNCVWNGVFCWVVLDGLLGLFREWCGWKCQSGSLFKMFADTWDWLHMLTDFRLFQNRVRTSKCKRSTFTLQILWWCSQTRVVHSLSCQCPVSACCCSIICKER